MQFSELKRADCSCWKWMWWPLLSQDRHRAVKPRYRAKRRLKNNCGKQIKEQRQVQVLCRLANNPSVREKNSQSWEYLPFQTIQLSISRSYLYWSKQCICFCQSVSFDSKDEEPQCWQITDSAEASTSRLCVPLSVSHFLQSIAKCNFWICFILLNQNYLQLLAFQHAYHLLCVCQQNIL